MDSVEKNINFGLILTGEAILAQYDDTSETGTDLDNLSREGHELIRQHAALSIVRQANLIKSINFLELICVVKNILEVRGTKDSQCPVLSQQASHARPSLHDLLDIPRVKATKNWRSVAHFGGVSAWIEGIKLELVEAQREALL